MGKDGWMMEGMMNGDQKPELHTQNIYEEDSKRMILYNDTIAGDETMGNN